MRAPTAKSAAPARIAVDTLRVIDPELAGRDDEADPAGSSGMELRIFCWT